MKRNDSARNSTGTRNAMEKADESMTEIKKNYSILMTAGLAQKTFENRKNMTRRILRTQPLVGAKLTLFDGEHAYFDDGKRVKFPYGGVGATVYVKETFYAYGRWIKTENLSVSGKNRWRFVESIETEAGYRYADNPPTSVRFGISEKLGWYRRPSLYMPKKAARTVVEIENISVQKLHDIPGYEAVLEGIDLTGFAFPPQYGTTALETAYKERFKELWISIHGAEVWHNNPWVWAILFKKGSLGG